MSNDDEILLIGDVMKIVRLSTTTIWRDINKGVFPRPDLILGKTRRAWLRSTITKHITDSIAKQKSNCTMKGLDHATM